MIVQAQVTIQNTQPNLQARLASHPLIIERSLLYYRISGSQTLITTRLQIEADTLEKAQQIFTDAFKIETTTKPNIQLIELDEN